MNSSFATLALLLSLALGTGAGLRVLGFSGPRPERPFATTLSGSLGGFRTLAADLSWLFVQVSWERSDVRATTRQLERTVAIDGRPIVFWVNGARMLAYDMAAWRTASESHGFPTAELRAKVDREQAQQALTLLARAEVIFPANPVLVLERANIQLNRLRDLEAACESYREAALLPGAPWYAARLHADLLMRLGQKTEAYRWLRKLHPTLPRQSEEAGALIVLARIRALEAELRVPPLQSYRAGL